MRLFWWWAVRWCTESHLPKRSESASLGRLGVILIFSPRRPVVILVLLASHDGAVGEEQAVVLGVGGVWGPDDFVGDDGGLGDEMSAVQETTGQKNKQADDDVGLWFGHGGTIGDFGRAFLSLVQPLPCVLS